MGCFIVVGFDVCGLLFIVVIVLGCRCASSGLFGLVMVLLVWLVWFSVL